jgi:CBS domain-containing protein
MCSTAKDIFRKSCYSKVDYKINENDNVQRAVVRFASCDIDCLAVVDNYDKLVGIFSESDFIKKVASPEKESAAIQIKDVCTHSPNILIARPTDSLELLMRNMHVKNIRHLVLVENKELQGLISMKDLFLETIEQDNKMTKRLAQGAYFCSE